MNIQFKKGVLELCVLAILSKKDCYGYELAKEISERFLIAEGSVYPLLRKLSKEGYFTTYLLESNEGPPRKYYKITKEGATYKEELQAEWAEFTEGVNLLLKGENTYE